MSEGVATSVPTVLVTGATGFLGGAAVAHLLRSHPACRVLLLVRGEPRAVAEERVRASLARFHEDGLANPDPRTCEVLLGDVTDVRALADPRLDDVTHLLHLAANTSFRSVRGVRHTNILGTLTLAHRTRRCPKLERFLYVGTSYVCGAAGERVVHEDDYPRPNVRHLVEYTASKADCEMLLENTAPELPLVVARPSVVVGHTRLGCGPSASLFWFYRVVDLLRRTTRPLDALEDVVPVDYTAEALTFLLFAPALRHRRYHVSAGAGSSVTWHEIAAVFARCWGERAGNPYRVVDFATIERERERMPALLGSGDEERLLMALRLYFQFSSLGVEVFDNSRLLEAGMPPPPRFTDYLEACATRPAGRSVYDQMLDDG